MCWKINLCISSLWGKRSRHLDRPILKVTVSLKIKKESSISRFEDKSSGNYLFVLFFLFLIIYCCLKFVITISLFFSLSLYRHRRNLDIRGSDKVLPSAKPKTTNSSGWSSRCWSTGTPRACHGVRLWQICSCSAPWVVQILLFSWKFMLLFSWKFILWKFKLLFSWKFILLFSWKLYCYSHERWGSIMLRRIFLFLHHFFPQEALFSKCFKMLFFSPSSFFFFFCFCFALHIIFFLFYIISVYMFCRFLSLHIIIYFFHHHLLTPFMHMI